MIVQPARGPERRHTCIGWTEGDPPGRLYGWVSGEQAMFRAVVTINGPTTVATTVGGGMAET
jgi:hypothetical protein